MKTITRRIGNVIDIGNSVGLTIRSELLDLGLNPGDSVAICVMEKSRRKKTITIEKV